ncbi:helix-turn-helix domain-containing protein [Bradyrhizobium diazoefficiens]
MTLSLRQLPYFVAIADAGALARAAEILNVAQSALSHHVSEIEAVLGDQLLHRRPRGRVLQTTSRTATSRSASTMLPSGEGRS